MRSQFTRAILDAPERRVELVTLPFEPPWLHTDFAVMWRRDRMEHSALGVSREAAQRDEAAVTAPGKPRRAVA
jgi:hypothetical protein